MTVTAPDGQGQEIDVVLDTGFNGFLTLPGQLVRALQLPFVGNRRVTLGDGSTVVLDIYLASTVWHGRAREILILQAGGEPVIGMALLDGNRVILHVVDDGDVLIDPIT